MTSPAKGPGLNARPCRPWKKNSMSCMARKTWADKGSRHERGYGSKWDRIRPQALKRDHYLCQPCQTKGRLTPAKEVDHIVPKSKGGTDDLTNLQSICTPCHRDKTAAEAAEAQGRTYRPRVEIGLDGWPVEG